MPRLLIVEDDDNKRIQLVQLIHESYPNCSLDQSSSLQGGLRALKEKAYTGVILDMTIPNYDPGPDESGGVIHALGGREFLRQMRRFKIDVPVVVVTQFETFGKGSDRLNLESLRASLAEQFQAICRGTVYYNSSIDDWKIELLELIRVILSGAGR